MSSGITDITLLKALMSRDAYERYAVYINKENLAHEVRVLFEEFKNYYKTFPEKEKISVVDFGSWFKHVQRPNMPDSAREIFDSVLENLNAAAEDVAQTVLARYQVLQAKQDLLAHFDDIADLKDIQEILERYSQAQSAIELGSLGMVENTIEAVIQANSRSGGLQWKLTCLRQAIGPLIKGDFGIIAAYVDTGKTSLAASEAVYMAKQIKDGKVLWLNNEEYNERVLQKIWQSTLGVSWDVLTKQPKRSEKEYIKRMNGDKDRITLIDIRNKTIKDISAIVKQVRPKLIVIDQIDKISNQVAKHWKEHDRLKSLYSEVRALANEFCPILAISQADSSSRWIDRNSQEVRYMKYLDQSQLDGSKVGKPGEADFIITIGKDPNYPNSRYIHVPKNKLTGEVASARNIKAEVIFDGDVTRFLDPT